MALLHLKGNTLLLGDKKVGFLSRDDEDIEKIWYISPRSRNKHYFIIWKGWGVAVEIVEFLERHSVYGVKLVIDGRELIMSSLPNLRLNGHVEQYKKFEPQIIMAEKHWLSHGQVML